MSSATLLTAAIILTVIAVYQWAARTLERWGRHRWT